MNLTGCWIGVLTYGPEYGDNAGSQVQFNLELTQQNHIITGLSKDIGGLATNSDPADIKGEVNGLELSFVKQYRSLHFTNSTVDKSAKGPKIFYVGQFDERSNEFSGTWQMGVKKRFFGLIPVNKPTLGTWKMKKMEELVPTTE